MNATEWNAISEVQKLLFFLVFLESLFEKYFE